MTDTPPLSPQESDDALAAEYVLGVQDLAERSALEARLRTDAGFAARVAAWETRLAGMNDAFPEVPAPNLLPQIEARLFPKPVLRRRWVAWSALALGGAIAAGLIFALATFAPLPQGSLVATLQTDDASLAYEVRHQGSRLTITRTAGAAAAKGQVHELWIIAPDAAPVALGLLETAALTVDYPLPPKGWTLAVSVEPAGGSPSGAPTGPVILVSKIGA